MPDNKKRRPLSPQMRHRLHEGLFLLAMTSAIFLFVSLVSYHTMDPGWSSTGIGRPVLNWGGKVGAWLSDVLLSLFGIVAYFFPFLLLLSSWLNMRELKEEKPRESIYKSLGWIFFTLGCCGLSAFYLKAIHYLPATTGGIVGDLLDNSLSVLFNKAGSTLIFLMISFCGVTFVTGFSWLGLIDHIGAWVSKACLWPWQKAYAAFQAFKLRRAESKACEPVAKKVVAEKKEPVLKRSAPSVIMPPVSVLPPPEINLSEKKKAMVKMDPSFKMAPGTLPPLHLLNPPAAVPEKAFAHLSYEALSQLVEQRLSDFGVGVHVVAVHPGPIITRFELELAPGVKVSKISGLAKDIARSLSVTSVRVVEVIPGKSVIGLEIPNENREIVSIREMVESSPYQQSLSPVSLVLGKDIAGHPVVVDLAKMPHLLVAGTTGSGKSVSVNAMLLSMLYKATPSALRLILIDPKMLELSIYDGIPHLLTPVITDMKDAANSLRWCVAEMDRRYRLMAAMGVRNLAGYNQKVENAIRAGEPLYMPTPLVTDAQSAKTQLETLPMIVVVADELADMMMVVGKKVEDLIARIAQKARAAGIHLILATQRPSVDVITGLIKANIPTRIAFQVSSRIDSRTILDQQGAEQLLGHGDMLYLPPGAGVPMRIHGAFVADEEVHRVVAAWRSVGEPTYLDDVVDESNELAGALPGESPQGQGEQDALYDAAVRIVMESRRASTSLIQRRLRIGYNRAARIMEEMEAAGVVSSMDQTGSREVLVGDAAIEV
jgi:S-DNA-T family DNA segregation ATPase FtsK/SpoIIIE